MRSLEDYINSRTLTGSWRFENYERPETNVNYPPIPEIYGFKRRYTEYSSMPYFPIVSVYVRAKGCYPEYRFQLCMGNMQIRQRH